MLAPSTPCANKLEGSSLHEATLHTGLSASELTLTHRVVSLGGLRLVCSARDAEEGADGLAAPGTRACWLLAEYVREHPASTVASRRVVALHAGVAGGATGLAAASAGASCVVLHDASDAACGLLHVNTALNAAWVRDAEVHVANVGDTPEELAAAYSPDLVLLADAFAAIPAAHALACALPSLLAGGGSGVGVVLAHEVASGGADGRDAPLHAFLTHMAAAGWTWTAARLHKTEQVYAVEHKPQPIKKEITSPLITGIAAVLGTLDHVPELPEDALGGHSIPTLPRYNQAAEPKLAIFAPRVLAEHVEALPLDELGPGVCTETPNGGAIEPTAEELRACPSAADTEAAAAADDDTPPHPTTWEGGPSPLLHPAGQEVDRVCSMATGTIVLLRFGRCEGACGV